VATPPSPPTLFQAQSYLLYQGSKFVQRFDANCYVALGEKMDGHDVARGRGGDWCEKWAAGLAPPPTYNTEGEEELEDAPLSSILPLLPPALILSIASDGLFTPNEQMELWEGMNGASPFATLEPQAQPNPKATIHSIPSLSGHDGFLLEFEIINRLVLEWLKARMPEVYEDAKGRSRAEASSAANATSPSAADGSGDAVKDLASKLGDLDVSRDAGDAFKVTKNSVFGEAEVDVMQW
jgi:homoserine O-acetyltransferase